MTFHSERCAGVREMHLVTQHALVEMVPSLAQSQLSRIESGRSQPDDETTASRRPPVRRRAAASQERRLARTVSQAIYRSDWKLARTSSVSSCGCSQAAKCPPLDGLL